MTDWVIQKGSVLPLDNLKTHCCQDQKAGISVLIIINLGVYIINIIYNNIANIVGERKDHYIMVTGSIC